MIIFLVQIPKLIIELQYNVGVNHTMTIQQMIQTMVANGKNMSNSEEQKYKQHPKYKSAKLIPPPRHIMSIFCYFPLFLHVYTWTLRGFVQHVVFLCALLPCTDNFTSTSYFWGGLTILPLLLPHFSEKGPDDNSSTITFFSGIFLWKIHVISRWYCFWLFSIYDNLWRFSNWLFPDGNQTIEKGWAGLLTNFLKNLTVKISEYLLKFING